MGSHNHFQDVLPAPPSADDFTSVKSKWVVMQQSKKSNLNDLASVPDFDLVDAAWLDQAPQMEPVGKPSKCQQQYELIVTHTDQPTQQGDANGSFAKDGELETILNNDTEADPPPPAPMFRDDEMESWLLATLADPTEGGQEGEKGKRSLGERTPNDTPKKKEREAEAGRPVAQQGSQSGRGGRSPSPVSQQQQQQLLQQQEQQQQQQQQQQCNLQRMQQRMKHQQQLDMQREQQQQQRELSQDGGRSHSGGRHGSDGKSAAAKDTSSLSSFQQQQQQKQKQLLQRSQQQRLARQENDERHQLALLKQLQAEEHEMQKQMQRKAEQALVAEGHEERFAHEVHASHAQLLQRQMLQHQQQQQHVEEEAQAAAGQHAQAAPLNFSHFSRPAHLYSRANLKTAVMRGAAAAPAGLAPQQSLPARPSGVPQQKLPGTFGRYGVLSPTSSGGGSTRTPLADPEKVPPRSSIPLRGEEHPHPHSLGAGARALAGGMTHKYAPLLLDEHHKDREEGVGSQGEQEKTSTVTETQTAVAAGRRRALKVEQHHLGERENTACSDLGPVERRGRAVGGMGGLMGMSAGADVSGRSTGSRLMAKRGREEMTEYTVSEYNMPEESEDGRKGGKKGEGEGGGGGQEIGGAAKRARAAEVHNMSERRRRDRINERMRMLQELIPNSNKTDKASMLDEAIEYLKMLQLQLQVMSMRSGMSIPSNLVPVPGSSFPPSGAGGGTTTSAVSQEEAMTLGGASSRMPMGTEGDMPDMGATALGGGVGAYPGLGEGGALGMGPMGMEREVMGMQGMAGLPGMPGDMGVGGAGRDVVSLPARQRLLMEMMQADMQDLQQQQHQQQQMLQQQMLMQQAKAGAMASLGRSVAATRSAGSGLMPPLGPTPKQEMLSRASALMPPQLSAPSAPFSSLRGMSPSAAGLSRSGFGMADAVPGGASLPMTGGGTPMGAMAAAAVMLEGHRQLNPSSVDPLDVYLARHQRMQQQQQMQMQEEEEQQQQQAALDFQMYQAILKRQHQTM